MHRIGLVSPLVLLLVVGSSAWSSSGDSPYFSLLRTTGRGVDDLMRKSYEEDEAPDYYYSYGDKRAAQPLYSFGLGKRNRAYGFGLGKRLEEQWKNSATLHPTYRQERRSKVYSFGLGKRGFETIPESGDDYVEDIKEAEKKSRQFSFGLGKRESGDVNSKGLSSS